MTPECAAARLTDPGLPRLVARLGFSEVDAAELRAVIPAIVADEAELERISTVASQLAAAVGLDAKPVELPRDGLTAILAHLVAIDAPRAFHAARGISEERSFEALADLGQQVRVHRRTFGELGLHTVPWTALLFTGRLYTLGRLQFDLHRADDGSWRIGTHIPATGPLESAAVDESFATAEKFFRTHFPDLAADDDDFARQFWCTSWLLNPELAQIAPGSNLAHFAARWTQESSSDDADDVVFFVWGKRPPYDLEALPRRTRLEKAVGERLADGRGWPIVTGRLRTSTVR